MGQVVSLRWVIVSEKLKCSKIPFVFMALEIASVHFEQISDMLC